MKTIAVFLLMLAAAAAKRYFHGDQVLKLTSTNQWQLKEIRGLGDRFSSVDFWTEPSRLGTVDLHVPRLILDEVKTFLAYNRIEFEIMIEDLQVAIDEQVKDRESKPRSLATFDYNVYHTYDEIMDWMDDMVAEYENVKLTTYGYSYEGRAIKALKLSPGGSNNPAFVIDCGLHAREWVAPATCLYTAKKIIEESNSYPSLSYIDVYITPLGNPDGYAYTWTNDRMWRKTRSDNNLICMGVDPNRNWDVNWSGPGASSSSCNDAYYGPSVMSEVEVAAKANFIAGLPNVHAYIDIHAYSQYWMYPYAYKYSFSNDEAFLRYLAGECATAIKQEHGKDYAYGPISEVIYQASGSTTDFMYEKLGIKCSFAAELRDQGRYGFTLPEDQILPTAEETIAGLEVIAKHVASGSCA